MHGVHGGRWQEGNPLSHLPVIALSCHSDLRHQLVSELTLSHMTSRSARTGCLHAPTHRSAAQECWGSRSYPGPDDRALVAFLFPSASCPHQSTSHRLSHQPPSVLLIASVFIITAASRRACLPFSLRTVVVCAVGRFARLCKPSAC